jgi:hypothetical protein
MNSMFVSLGGGCLGGLSHRFAHVLRPLDLGVEVEHFAEHGHAAVSTSAR